MEAELSSETPYSLKIKTMDEAHKKKEANFSSYSQLLTVIHIFALCTYTVSPTPYPIIQLCVPYIYIYTHTHIYIYIYASFLM